YRIPSNLIHRASAGVGKASGPGERMGGFHRGDPAGGDPGGGGDLFLDVVELGAILAVVAIYFQVFWKALIGLPTSVEPRRFALGLILALLPSVAAGLALQKMLDEVPLNPSTAMPFIAGCWIVGGIIILVFERIAPKPRWLEGDKLPLSKAFQI